MNLNLKPKSECKYDAVSLGEVMLRLDPGEGRIRTARSFRAWEGGGEYNVVRGLRKCFKMNTGVITAFADNEVGKLMEDFICQGGVDTSLIKWMKTESDVYAETVSTLQREASVSVVQSDALTEQILLFQRQHLRILISITSLVSLESDGFIQAVSMQQSLSRPVRQCSQVCSEIAA